MTGIRSVQVHMELRAASDRLHLRLSEILVVVRRQAKLEADRRNVTGKTKEPVAGTSRQTTEMKMMRVTQDTMNKSQKEVNRETTTAVARERRQGQEKQRSTGLSQAKINVTKTMIFIVLCFTVCWMPRASYVLYRKFTVMLIKSLLSVIIYKMSEHAYMSSYALCPKSRFTLFIFAITLPTVNQFKEYLAEI